MKFFKVCSLVFLFLVIHLTVTPLFDTLVAQEGTEDTEMEMVIGHMGIMMEQHPEKAQKREQVEEELNNGTLTPKGACSRCHTPAQGAP